MNNPLSAAKLNCEKITKNHYENFPVASILLPKNLRFPIASIYAFARTADDIADEGDLPATEKLSQLNAFEKKLSYIVNPSNQDNENKDNNDYKNNDKNDYNISNSFNMTNNNMANNTDYIFISLEHVIRQHKLPIQAFFDLLHAFKQDVVKSTYQNHAEVLEYCQYSANPIGRLLLHLTQNDSEKNLQASDAICTALQLINFLQDLYEDVSLRQRCYLPMDEMKRANVNLEDIKNKHQTKGLSALIEQQLTKILQLLDQGSHLGSNLKGRFGFEIRLIITCAYFMVQKLAKRKNAFERPTIQLIHWPSLLLKSIF